MVVRLELKPRKEQRVYFQQILGPTCFELLEVVRVQRESTSGTQSSWVVKMLQILSQSKRQLRIMVVAGMILRAHRFSCLPSSILFATYATLQITFHYTNV